MFKICHLTSAHTAFDTRIYHKELQSLVHAGYGAVLIAQNDKNEERDGVKIISLKKPRNRFARTMSVFNIFAKAIKEKADIYHFHDPELIIVGLALKIVGKKVIYDIHEDYPKAALSREWIPSFLRKIVAFSYNSLEKPASNFFDYLIAASPSIERNFKGKKIISVRNFPLLKECDHRSEEPDKDEFCLVYIGNVSKANGITKTIEALGILPENCKVKFKVFGSFAPDSYCDELKTIKGFEKGEFFGQIPFEEVFKNLSGADAGIICALPEPNAIESEPNKLFEYMMAGIPVIASDFPLWKEIVSGNKCGINVNPLNVSDIAKVIQFLIQNQTKAREMGENSRKSALEKYNWRLEAEKMLGVYEKLLKV